MDGIKYVVFTETLQKKVFGYWGTINILLMSNQDQLGQK
uniref:Ribosomal protein L23 n=1 Tax=Lindera benzoin TaxID=55958 RepID=A0A345BC71_LINBE|nr:ribosomal protein L23 [Lindera benzoin]